MGTKSYHKNRVPFMQYCTEHCSPMDKGEHDLTEKTLKHPRGKMLGSSDQIRFLASICRSMGAKKTLDVGVFTGFSALCVAKALPDDGKVIACDITDEYYADYCKPAWTEAGVLNKIDFRVAPAIQTLKALLDDNQAGTFDFAFIDAMKTEYLDYFELCLKLVRTGGIIAIDNTLWSGGVLPDSGKDDEPDVIALRKFNDTVMADNRVDTTMLLLGDGTTVAVKK